MFFFTSFPRGKNLCDFQFALLNEALSKWGLLSKERICSKRSKFFPLRVDLHWDGRQNENGRVASPESVSIHHNPTALRKAKTVYNFGLSECKKYNFGLYII